MVGNETCEAPGGEAAMPWAREHPWEQLPPLGSVLDQQEGVKDFAAWIFALC